VSNNPSVFTPFFRRFADERQLANNELVQLYQAVAAQQAGFRETNLTIGQRVYDKLNLPQDVARHFAYALYELLAGEAYLADLPRPDLHRMNLKDAVEYQNLLEQKRYFLANQPAQLEALNEALMRTIAGLAEELPQLSDPTPFTIPLLFALPDPRLAVESMLGILGDYHEKGILKPVSEQLYRNLLAANGNPRGDHKPLDYPTRSNVPVGELVDTYLRETPFANLFNAPVPLRLTREDRFNHWHILGGTGAGKTTLIKNLILHDLSSPDPPSLVVIDPHGDLIRELSQADLGIEDRLIIIDPRDIQYPPALNVFALNRERMEQYDEVTREQVTASVIQTFDYLFSGLTGLRLTGKQEVFFRYVARLMLALPDAMGRNATILDMLHLMRDPAPYGAAIEQLPTIQRDFFLHDFTSKTFEATKDQIRYRLQAIIENPTLARLFTCPETKVDLFAELNRGSVVLVDTAKDFLKSGSSTFGRIFISLALQAVLERAAIPAAKRKDTFLIVDEAASYFDSNIDDLLTEARKYRCGLVLAHQYLDQASGTLKASLAANTGIKFASGLSASDARAMAPEMRTSADFILDQPRLQFAAHIKNVTPQAVSIPIEPTRRMPQLAPQALKDLTDRNRERVSRYTPYEIVPSPGVPLTPIPPPEQHPNPDSSPDW